MSPAVRLETDRARSLLQQCTVRISVAGTHAGTGFFVGPGHLLTCAHVVANEAREVKPDISVEWRHDGRFESFPATAEVANDAQVDLALLTLAGPAPNHPSTLLSKLVSTRDELTSYGYPTGYEDGDQATFDVEGSSLRGDCPLLKIKDGQADWGASGSPLLNDRLRSVCAVLTLSRDVTSALGGRATPVDLAFKEWPHLRELQAGAEKQNPAWAKLTPVPLWFVAQGEQHERIFRHELHQRESAVTHPLANLFAAFIAQEPWHEYIRRLVGHLADKRSEAIGSFPHIPMVPVIDYSGNYDSIIDSMRAIAGGELSAWLRSQLDELEHRKHSRVLVRDSLGPQPTADSEVQQISALIHKLASVRGCLNDVADEARQPNFQECFLVVGDMGAGKTHFLASLLLTQDRQTHPDMLALLLRPRFLGGGKLADYLLKIICERTRVNWDSLAEFDSYLGSFDRPLKLIIAIDDLQTMTEGSEFLDDLRSCISENTQLHSLFWVVALDHQSYDRVAGSSQFWTTYGYDHAIEHSTSADTQNDKIGSWIQLDDLNVRQQTGIQIIREVVSADADRGARVLSGIDHATASTRQHLARPFIAWVLLDIRAQLQEAALVDLNFISFIRKFWETLLPRLTEDGRIQKRLSSCVTLVAKYLMEQGNFSPPESELIDFIIAAAKGRSDLAELGNAPASIRMLQSGGLLSVSDVRDDDLESIRRIVLSFDVFWNWNLGKRLRREFERAAPGAPAAFLELWLDKYAADSSTASAILQFFLLSLEDVADGPEKPVDAAAKNEIWRWAAASPKAPSGAAWFAASRIDGAAQDRVACSLLLPLPQLRDDKRDLFGLIYFLASLSAGLPQGLNTPEIFRLLKKYYRLLRVHRATMSPVCRHRGRSRRNHGSAQRL